MTDPPHPDRVAYSVSNRSTCRGCGRPIAKGALRLTRYVRSFHYDGFEPHQYHLQCTSTPTAQLHPSWRHLRVKDQLELIAARGGEVPTAEEQARWNAVWKMHDDVVSVLPGKMVESLLIANGCEESVAKPGKLEKKGHNTHFPLLRVADGLAHGMPPLCPMCNGVDLVIECGMARCCGHLPGGATKCPFKGAAAPLHAQRRVWVTPDEARKHKALKALLGAPDDGGAKGKGKKRKGADTDADDVQDAAADGVQKCKGKVATKKEAAPPTPKLPKLARIKEGSQILRPDSVVVDQCGPRAAIVTTEDGSIAYNAMLHVANIESNINKFYTIQVIRMGGSRYAYFIRWGRIGDSGYSKSGGWSRYGSRDTNPYRLNEMPKTEAIAEFEKKFAEQTGNLWTTACAGGFKRKPGKYDMVELAAARVEEGPTAIEQIRSHYQGGKKARGECGAAPQGAVAKDPSWAAVRKFVAMISDTTMMQHQMSKYADLDTRRMPLGGLSSVQVQKGYAVLKEADGLVKQRAAVAAAPSPDAAQLSALDVRLKDATNRFYGAIPHSFNAAPPLLDNDAIIASKGQLLADLSDLAAAAETLKAAEGASSTGPGDERLRQIYAQMQCELTALERGGEEWQRIATNVANTHGLTHGNYSLQITSVFKVCKRGEAPKFDAWRAANMKREAQRTLDGAVAAPPASKADEDPRVAEAHTLTVKQLQIKLGAAGITKEELKALKLKAQLLTRYLQHLRDIAPAEAPTLRERRKALEPSPHDNLQLLWHGSRLSNWLGILSKGLRIAPLEAPVTGYMFDKGVYFANSVSKSANYCFADDFGSKGVLLLSEVALGKPRKLTQPDMHAAKHAKDEGAHSTWGMGRTTPDASKAMRTESGAWFHQGRCDKLHTGGGLEYDEFIVYDTDQIQMKYIVVCDFV